MKKNLFFVFLLGLCFVVSCGGGKKEENADADNETGDDDVVDSEVFTDDESDITPEKDDGNTAPENSDKDSYTGDSETHDSDTDNTEVTDNDTESWIDDNDTKTDSEEDDNEPEEHKDACEGENPCEDIEYSDGVCAAFGVAGEKYACGCTGGYFWNGEKCIVDPCKTDSCSGAANSTGKCVPRTETAFSCECAEGYFWNGSGCSDPCSPNLCAETAHSADTCTIVADLASYKCECNDDYYWWGTKGGCLAQEPVFGRICTGQSKCYGEMDNDVSELSSCPEAGEEFYGQDANFAREGFCILRNFEIKGTGSEKTVFDNNLKLEWQQTVSSEMYNWSEAMTYCENLEYAGYSDWRLPAPKELLSIVDDGRSFPTIDTDYFPSEDKPIDYMTASGYFWTSKKYADEDEDSDGEEFWYVRFWDGRLRRTNGVEKQFRARCVRGKSLPNANFVESKVGGDEIVTDTVTGLVWQKTSVSSKKWQEAVDYCNNLEYAGFKDWRLPNKNEFLSIINYDRVYPASDFPGLPTDYEEHFVTSTTFDDLSCRVWIMDLSEGEPYHFYKSDKHKVRCVR